MKQTPPTHFLWSTVIRSTARIRISTYVLAVFNLHGKTTAKLSSVIYNKRMDTSLKLFSEFLSIDSTSDWIFRYRKKSSRAISGE